MTVTWFADILFILITDYKSIYRVYILKFLNHMIVSSIVYVILFFEITPLVLQGI